MKDKRGFQMAINTIVILILAVMVLLFLVLFFTSSGGSLIEKITSYFTYSNVDSVINGCNVLVTTNSNYAFCCDKKNVKYYSEGKKKGEFSCAELINQSFVAERVNRLNCEGVGCE